MLASHVPAATPPPPGILGFEGLRSSDRSEREDAALGSGVESGGGPVRRGGGRPLSQPRSGADQGCDSQGPSLRVEPSGPEVVPLLVNVPRENHERVQEIFGK